MQDVHISRLEQQTWLVGLLPTSQTGTLGPDHEGNMQGLRSQLELVVSEAWRVGAVWSALWLSSLKLVHQVKPIYQVAVKLVHKVAVKLLAVFVAKCVVSAM